MREIFTHAKMAGEINITYLFNTTMDLYYNGTNFSVLNHTTIYDDIDLTIACISGFLLGVLVLLTIVGNVLVLLAVILNNTLRSPTNFFIMNLALADLLLGCTVLPFSAALEVLGFWPFGNVFCNVWAAMDVLCCTASILSLCVISIDRYIGVTRPLRHGTIVSEKRAGYTCAGVWVLSIAISVAPLFGWKEPPPDDPRICSVTKQLGYVLFSVSGSFYIPLFIILLVYVRVYQEARTQSRFLNSGVKTERGSAASSEVTLRIHRGRTLDANPESTTATVQQQNGAAERAGRGSRNPAKLTLAGKMAKFNREKKAAKTLGIVVGVFIICWFPFFFILPLEALCRHCVVPLPLFKTIFWLGYCNSMMNPFIYAASSREFKRAFLAILRCRFRRPRVALETPCQRSGGSRAGNGSRADLPLNRLSAARPSGGIRQFFMQPFARVRRPDKLCASASDSSARALLAQRHLPQESPIASLRELHARAQERSRVAQTPMSDEEDFEEVARLIDIHPEPHTVQIHDVTNMADRDRNACVSVKVQPQQQQRPEDRIMWL